MSKIEIINEEIFKIGKYEFIKFVGDNGDIIGVLKDSLGDMRFGNTNDFSKSDILKKLNKEFLPEGEHGIINTLSLPSYLLKSEE